MDAKESAEHAAAAAAQYKEAQTPTSPTDAKVSPKRDRTASLDDVDDAKPIADYRARGVCKAALGKSFLFGRRWTPGTYAVDVDRSHIVRFEDDAAGTCWEDTPTNRYAFAGDCDVKESGDTWDAVLELSRVADLLAKDAKPQSLALKFPTSTRRDQFRRAIDEARRRDPAAEALNFARSQIKDDHFSPPRAKPTRKAPTPPRERSKTPEPKRPASPFATAWPASGTSSDDIFWCRILRRMTANDCAAVLPWCIGRSDGGSKSVSTATLICCSIAAPSGSALSFSNALEEETM